MAKGDAKRSGRGRRWLRRLVWLAVIVLVLAGGYVAVGEYLLEPIAREQIQNMAGEDVAVEIGEIDFAWEGAAYLKNLTMRSQAAEPSREAMFTAEQVEAEFSWWSVLRLNPRIGRVTIRDFEATARYDTQEKRWNVQVLKAGEGGEGPLPTVVAEEGTIRLQTTGGEEVRTLALLRVDAALTPVEDGRNEYRFSVKTRERSGWPGSELQGTWTRGDESHVEARGRLLMGDMPVWGNRWDLRDIRAEVSYDSQQVQVDELSWRLGQQTAVSVTGRVTELDEEPRYEADLTVEDLPLSEESTPNALVWGQGLQEHLGRGAARFFERYSPEGTGDIRLHASGRLDTDFRTDSLQGTVQVDDVDILPEKFPYAMSHLAGTIQVTEDSAVLEDLRGRHGDVFLTISGYTEGSGDQRSTRIQIQSANMRFNEDLQRAMDENQKRIWMTFSPEGMARIEYLYHKLPGSEKQVSVDVWPLEAQAVYQHFPYPLRNLTGHLAWNNERVVLDRVVSAYDGRRIELNGTASGFDEEQTRFNIVIDANDIPVDSVLRAALPPKQREFYERLDIEATTDVQIRVFPSHSGKRQVEYIANASIKDARVEYEKIPMPLEDLNMRAVLTPELFVVEQLEARAAGGQVRAEGKVWPANEERDEMGLCLQVEAEGVELAAEWLSRLPEKAAMVAETLRPSGRVDFTADVNLNTPDPACRPMRAQVTFLGTNMHYEPLGLPIRGLTGTALLTEEAIELDNLRAERIVLDDTLEENSVGRLKRILNTLEPAGELSLRLDQAKFWRDEAGDGWVSFDGGVGLHGLSLGAGAFISDIEAQVNAEGVYSTKEGLVEGAGWIDSEHFLVKGRAVNRLRGELYYDPEEEAYFTRNLRADIGRGRVIADVQVHEPTEYGTHALLEVAFDHVQPARLLSERLAGERILSVLEVDEDPGTVSGSFTIGGNVEDLRSMMGRLSVHVRHIELAKRSLFGKVLAALQLNEPTDYIFHEIVIEAYLRGARLLFEQVKMIGPSMVLQGQGGVNLDSMQVSMDLRAGGEAPGSEPGILQSLIDALGGTMLKVKVRGDVDDPKVTTEALGGF